MLSAKVPEAVHSVSKSAVTNFAHTLVAVLVGNAAYFLLMPYLPPGARHQLFRVDVGLAVDFWLCLVVFGTIKTVARWRRHDLGNP